MDPCRLGRFGLVLAGLTLAACSGGDRVGSAKEVEQACLQSGRAPGQAECACAADLSQSYLNGRDQALAAAIIREPDRYQTVRGQARRATFLDRYRAWGDAAASYCTAQAIAARASEAADTLIARSAQSPLSLD